MWWEKKFVLSQFKNGDWKELVEVKVGYLDTKPANWREIRPFSAEKEVKTFALLEAQAGGLYRSIGLVSKFVGKVNQIKLHVDKNGYALSFDLLEIEDESKENSLKWTTAANISPPLVKTKQEQKKVEAEAKQEEGSFFSKYWHIIIPILLFIMLSGSTPPEENKEGGGAASAGAKAKN